MAIGPYKPAPPLNEVEQRKFDQIVNGLREDNSDVKLPLEFPKSRRRLVKLGAAVVGGMAFVGGIGFGLQLIGNNATENNHRTAKAVEQVLESNRDLAQLGICNAELSAQADYLAAPGTAEYASRDYRAKPESGWYKDTVNRPGTESLPCSPAQPNAAVTVEVDGAKVVVIPTDVVDFNTETWCIERKMRSDSDRAIGERMMQAAGISCTDIAAPLPTTATR